MKDDILYALAAANSAPSGENSQPWRFVVSNDIVELWNRPERDRSLYNWQQSASYLANGAALENMVIAATVRGLKAEVEYFPSSQTDHVATVQFVPGATLDTLESAIPKRTTNRKPFLKDPLSAAQLNALTQSFDTSSCTLRILTERSVIERLGRIGSTNEEIMFTNKHIHDFFFDHVSWTAHEDGIKKVGFFIDTLELPPPGRFVFRLLRIWPIAKILTSLGLHRLVAKENGVVNAAAAAIGVVCVKGPEPKDMVQAGRAIERMWLTATSLGLSVQPLTGVLFFDLMRTYGDASKFSVSHTRMIKEAVEEVARLSGFTEGTIIFMFRVGISDPPTARSSRFSLDQACQAT